MKKNGPYTAGIAADECHQADTPAGNTARPLAARPLAGNESGSPVTVTCDRYKYCELCGRAYTYQRSTARFCGNACRQAHFKGRIRKYMRE
jgi:hypothetical protein